MEKKICENCNNNEVPAYRKKYCDECAKSKKAEWEAPITQSEKIVDAETGQRSTPATLMDERSISIVSQVLVKAYGMSNTGLSPQEIFESYNFFVKSFEDGC